MLSLSCIVEHPASSGLFWLDPRETWQPATLMPPPARPRVDRPPAGPSAASSVEVRLAGLAPNRLMHESLPPP